MEKKEEIKYSEFDQFLCTFKSDSEENGMRSGKLILISKERSNVKISKEQKSLDNSVCNQRDNGQFKFWIPSELNAKDSIDAKEAGTNSSNYYLEVVAEVTKEVVEEIPSKN